MPPKTVASDPRGSAYFGGVRAARARLPEIADGSAPRLSNWEVLAGFRESSIKYHEIVTEGG